jgi:hypothetical protein
MQSSSSNFLRIDAGMASDPRAPQVDRVHAGPSGRIAALIELGHVMPIR